jgi:hypothetical protein
MASVSIWSMNCWPRVALRVLVGQHGARGLEHGERDVVLRRDEPDLLELPARLLIDQSGDLRIGQGDVRNGRLVHGDLLEVRLHRPGLHGTQAGPSLASARRRSPGGLREDAGRFRRSMGVSYPCGGSAVG